MIRDAALRRVPAFAALLAACGGGGAALNHHGPSGAMHESEAPRCRDATGGTEQLTVGWTPEERADLEARSRDGVVIVRYQGCQLDVLRDCQVKGGYAFEPAAMKEDQVVLTSDAELEQWMPDQARRLRSEMRAAGGLVIRTATLGRRMTALPSVAPADLVGDCQGATHFVAAMAMGAFEMSTAGGDSASPNPAPQEPGPRGRTLTKGGDPAACSQAPDAARPPERCAEIVRIELAPIGATRGSDSVNTQAPPLAEPPPAAPPPAEPGDPEHGRH